MKTKKEYLPDGFTVEGSAALCLSRMPPICHRAKAILDALPDNKLVSSMKLSDLVECHSGSVAHTFVYYLKDNYQRVQRSNLWGSEKTIKRLRAALSKKA